MVIIPPVTTAAVMPFIAKKTTLAKIKADVEINSIEFEGITVFALMLE